MLVAFEETTPRTLEGVLALTRAYLALRKADEARALLAPYWRKERFPSRAEEKILAEFGGLLTRDDHRHRMIRMLHIDRIGSAERVAELAGREALAAAWAAVTRGEADAGKLIAEVPKAERGPAYLFVKTRYLRRAGKISAAAETMRQAPTDAGALVDPDAWWIERRVLSRELLDIGKPEAAYEIAASHAAASPVHAVDAEFHAGWYALRFLDAPEKARGHFRRIVELSDGPISLARGHYWLARALEAAGEDAAARDHFVRAAEHQTAFYGQIAAARLSSVETASLLPEIGTDDRRHFGARPAVHAIRRLEAIEAYDEADALYRALAHELNDAGEIMLLAEMAETRGDHRLALRVGKWAAARGLEVGAIAFPVGAIPETSDISAAGTALAYAIARQESEFNASARSPAGALGMLQLLPGTARDMARAIGVSYEPARLTRDAAYNAQLGAAYLGTQLERFDGSYILTFAGYNAGPRRAREWVERYGDPRGAALKDVIDWIERIPYHETRAYVQRVMENYQVYKMRLSGRMDIVEDLTQGRD
jgi:soluble lytic murein transglycosylase